MFDLDEYVQEQLKDPEFRKAYEEGMEENEAIRAKIAASCARNAAREERARRTGRRQAKIRRSGNGACYPSVSPLKRIADIFGGKRRMEFRKKSS